MASKFFAENYYSFRAVDRVFIGAYHPSSPDPAALIAIEDALVTANSAFVARRYQEAIDAYHRAESLIYANLDPGFPGGVRFDDRLLSKDPGLFMPLLSTA